MTESVGQQLRKARLARSLTLEQAAQETHMRLHYLQALEADDFDALPSMVQARGFLRLYADYLGLDAAPLLGALNSSTSAQVSTPAPPVKEEPAKAGTIPAPGLEIFQQIGQKLKQQRELLGLSLQDVERYTRLRINNLKALEAGNLEQLLSPVQARGMLGAYAEFLGLDPEPLLLRFAQGLQARLKERQAAQPPRRHAVRHPLRLPASLRWMFSIELIFATILVIGLVVFFVWAGIRILGMQEAQSPSPTAPSIVEVLLATGTEPPTLSPIPSTPTLPPPLAILPQETQSPPEVTLPPAGEGDAVRVYVTVRQRAWMRVVVDGKLAFEGRVAPGSAFQYVGEQQVEILTGNAAALDIFYNQQDYGVMGLFGQVAHQIFTQQGILTPTPTVTVTPTRTPRLTQTPVATAAP